MNGIRLFRTVQVKLIIIYVLLILIAMQLIGVYFISTVKNSLTESFTSNLKDQANLLSEMAVPTLSGKVASRDDKPSDSAELSNLVRNLFSISEAEIQVLDSSGKVLATSDASHQSYVGKKNTSLAVTRALQSIRDNEEEIIDEDNVRKKIIAQPVIYEGGRVIGAVYIVASMNDLYSTMDRVNRIFVTGTLLALGLTGVLGVLLAHTITSPIKTLTRSAAAIAEGRFDQQVKVLGDDEIGRLSEAFNDMTNRLREALSVNEEERDKLASVLANMSDGVVAADQSGHVIVSNRRALELLDVTECEGEPLTQLLGLSQEDMTELQKTSGSRLLYQESEDGSEWLLRVTFTPVHRRDKGTTSTIVILEDVTEQEKLEQSRREFVANVSHELRTPLTTIKSYAEALDEGALDERQLADRFVNVIRNETERMIRLVTDLLHLSRFDSNQAPLRRSSTNLPELLEEAADRFAFQMNQKEIQSEVRIEDGVGSVWLDRDGIDQVLDNLLSNAIKYTQGGGSIVLTARRPDAHSVSISVKDAGIGIPKKDMGRIFDRFYRVDKARSRNMGGTGLGLSIAREIVRAHGGTISLDSELNVGTTVTFTLPTPDLKEGGESA
ncbi:two-component system sensor histidine kinase VicK [Paenibacillus cellulosilyticus]|uniref:histidine kinase n=1 Tax=Paenibacillus cellulosilyticus TaxID=375489 RepID=A0A2V2Z148_9BACL|nr:cell wall metabolism sensor histidine kinase WalK [Paenibacillus cellulosilyticus]PWW08805.1 two-component system sensor histidine kinase VicK [Paenibacillus cellulosilyticus]QKS48357.1 cell wall metabolism sensor histidine kinase WalK [Paenibacillus cellulosilyticus]